MEAENGVFLQAGKKWVFLTPWVNGFKGGLEVQLAHTDNTAVGTMRLWNIKGETIVEAPLEIDEPPEVQGMGSEAFSEYRFRNHYAPRLRKYTNQLLTLLVHFAPKEVPDDGG